MACSERANDWGMATSAPRLARTNSSMGSGRHVLIAPLIWGEGGGGRFLLQSESWSLHQHALLWGPQ